MDNRIREFAYGFADQGLSSGVTFLLTLVAARSLGPDGVGTIAIGFGGYLVVVALARALVIDPYLTRFEKADAPDSVAISAALSITLAGGVLATLTFYVGGAVLQGPIGSGLLLFAPWLVPALAQALLRAAVFRAAAGRRAVLSTGIWLGLFIAGVALGLGSSEAALVGAWGVGATGAAVALLIPIRKSLRIAGVRDAATWFRGEALGLGKWLSAATVGAAIAMYALVASLGALLGPAAVGGYRAIESAFSPVSLIGPALTNPGVRIMQLNLHAGRRGAIRLALLLSGVAVGITVAYCAIVALFQTVVFRIYGSDFAAYSSLIFPVAVGQTLVAATAGWLILLKAGRRGRAIAVVAVSGPSAALAFGLPLAATSGLTSAAWGIAAAMSIPLAIATGYALGSTASTDAPETTEPRAPSYRSGTDFACTSSLYYPPCDHH